jgi:hypothetical protein
LHLARIEAAGNTQSRPRRRAVRSVAQALWSASGLALAAAVLVSVTGCGNTYRPVVSAINPVGPAAQPQKFAVVISTTGTTTANTTATFSSGASSITVSSVTGIVSGQLVVGAGIASGTTVSGSPSGTTVNLSSPTTAAESSTPVVFSNPTPGLVTFVDFSGDTTLITAQIGVNPYYLILNSGGTTGFTLNSDHTLTTFDISTALLQSQILQTTLLPGANPVSIFPEGTNTYVTDTGLNAISNSPVNPLICSSSFPLTRPSARFMWQALPALRASMPSASAKLAVLVRSPLSRAQATPSIPIQSPWARIPSTVS